MTRRWARWGRACAAIAMAAAAAAAPTSAQEACPPGDQGPGPSVVLTAPNDTEPITSQALTEVQGTAEQRNGRVDCVLLVLTRNVDGQPVEVGRRVLVASAESPQPFPIKWLPPTPYNDVYTVVAQAVGTIPNFDTFAGQPTARQFRTQIPPVKPTGVKVALDQEKRKATVTWAKNPEADVVGYIVDRAQGDGEFKHLADVPPDPPSHVDDLAAAEPATYRYRITAVRRESQAPDAKGLSSPPSSEARTTLKGPATATTTTSPTTSKPVAGAPRTTAKPKSAPAARRVDLGRFGPTTTTPPGESLEPEEGAFGDMDFGQRQDGRSDMTIREVGEPVGDGGNERPTSLLFVAAGLLAFVVLLHLRWLKKEVDRLPTENVPVEPGAP